MIGKDAFCPETGAPLSEEPEYDGQGRPQHVSLPDDFSTDTLLSGQLTNGEVTSSKAALFNHFRRCHQRHAEVDNSLYRKAALDLQRLKSAADGREDWDVHIWYTLRRRLAERGFAVDWMHAHAKLRCPHCHGTLRYKLDESGNVYGFCGVNCMNDRANQLQLIRETIEKLYSKSFSGSITIESVLRIKE